ncbi:MAG: FHA domain-containing protein [Planctomycetota bacterium]
MASITVIFGGQEQQTYQFDKPKLIVGREPSCEIHIDNLGISRQHCAFSMRGEVFVVQDMGSSNGTFVNNHKITEHFLNHDDEVVISKYTLKFKNQSQPTPTAVESPDELVVPGSLNTYMMDGGKVQEQLAKLRVAQGKGVSKTNVPLHATATAKDYAQALDVLPSQDAATTKLKTYVVALTSVIVVLLVVIILMMTKII